MLRLPVFDVLEKSKNVLIAGAGGGYDIFCGLPLYFGMRAEGKNVHLANLSFSFLPPEQATGEARIAPAVLKVVPETPLMTNYFPELLLSQWFRTQGEEVPIYCFERTGAMRLRAGYEALVRHLEIDTIVLIDGGTDSLMRGDEIGLGTPQEDIASIAAVSAVNTERKLLMCVGFGVDTYHGVSHGHFLEAVAELTHAGGYLGMFSLVNEMPEVQKYREAADAVFEAMAHHVSIVSSSILSALEGRYGNHHATSRTAGSVLWINPLMPVYWCFNLAQVAARVMYLKEVSATSSYDDVSRAIALYRKDLVFLRPAEIIPA
jgi:hypothetical protein